MGVVVVALNGMVNEGTGRHVGTGRDLSLGYHK